MATTTLLTAENHELVDVSGNTLRHNLLRCNLLTRMLPLAGEKRGTVIAGQEFDFQGNVHNPDISFFGVTKQALLDLDESVQRFVPDLAIEIASASDTYEGLLIKKDRYLQAGTIEVWLISPRTHEIKIYTHNRVLTLQRQGQIETDLLPGLSIDLAELFREL